MVNICMKWQKIAMKCTVKKIYTINIKKYAKKYLF